MKLHLSEATSADLDIATQFYGPKEGDLCAPAIRLFWPLANSDDVHAAAQRTGWSCQQQKDILENDPTTRFVKVVDLDNDGELVAFGRWHRYTNGYVPAGDLEYAGLKDRNDPGTWPGGLQKELYCGCFYGLLTARDEWIGRQHCWSIKVLTHPSSLLFADRQLLVLTTLKTREPFQRNGAGSMILQWGLKEAAKEQVPAYLEAAPDAKHLYEAHGFREVGTDVIEGAKFGIPDFRMTVSLMKADAK